MSTTSDYISNMEHGVIAVVGSGKQGKSCTLHSMLALWQPDRLKYLLDPMDFDVSAFPGYFKVDKVSDIPVGAICIIEDVNRVFHSRGSSKDATLQKWLGVISHKSNLVCFTTQSLAGTDLEFLRSQDSVIVHKYMHEEDIPYERPEHRVTQSIANGWIDAASKFDPGLDRRSWAYFPRFNQTISIPKVEWWSEKNSHFLRQVDVCR